MFNCHSVSSALGTTSDNPKSSALSFPSQSSQGRGYELPYMSLVLSQTAIEFNAFLAFLAVKYDI